MVLYEMAGMGATLSGPAGVLVSLGVEKVVTTLPAITAIYNYFSIFTLLLISVMASQRDVKFISLIIPLWAGLCMFFGWLKFVDAGSGFGIIVVCCMIAIMNYMQETRHEKFGIAGPGNTIIKIFTFVVVLQCVVVFVNSDAVFNGLFPGGDTQRISASNNQYSNIDMSTQITSINNTGGLFAQIVDIVSASTQIAISALRLLGECLLSIGLFAVVLAQVFPWITDAGAIGVAFLVALQFAIWTMYAIFIIATFYRPGPDPGW